MKIYTEEEVRKAIELARLIQEKGSVEDSFDVESISGLSEICTYGWSERYSTDEISEQLTPIELPSATAGLNQNDNDKELFYQKQVMNPYNTVENTYTAYEKGFIEGWYKAKQTYGGNK